MATKVQTFCDTYKQYKNNNRQQWDLGLETAKKCFIFADAIAIATTATAIVPGITYFKN